MIACSAVAVAATAARADEHPVETAPEPTAAAPVRPSKAGALPDLRGVLGGQLAAQTSVVERSLSTVTDKLAGADAVRVHRLRAAYRLLRAPSRAGTSEADRMAVARLRAAARLLVEQDRGERGLLAEETDQLRNEARRLSGELGQVAKVALPEQIARPVRGPVVRRFGIVEHERSHVALSRRGVDFDVDLHALVTSPADGTVRYAGPIRGLDSGVIIDHGDYFTVIGKLGEIGVPVGAPVHSGDRLGRAAHRRVYLEVRVRIGPGGLPIDPEPLLAKRS